eukprot:GHVN01106545.1.p1 GENE.GHVN01106545.1~~GHVN01106545.1.p1  ORF type:complete len:863 (+),score=59.74 GHVN01106545.1:253-2841(+)
MNFWESTTCLLDPWGVFNQTFKKPVASLETEIVWEGWCWQILNNGTEEESHDLEEAEGFQNCIVCPPGGSSGSEGDSPSEGSLPIGVSFKRVGRWLIIASDGLYLCDSINPNKRERVSFREVNAQRISPTFFKTRNDGGSSSTQQELRYAVDENGLMCYGALQSGGSERSPEEEGFNDDPDFPLRTKGSVKLNPSQCNMVVISNPLGCVGYVRQACQRIPFWRGRSGSLRTENTMRSCLCLFGGATCSRSSSTRTKCDFSGKGKWTLVFESAEIRNLVHFLTLSGKAKTRGFHQAHMIRVAASLRRSLRALFLELSGELNTGIYKDPELHDWNFPPINSLSVRSAKRRKYQRLIPNMKDEQKLDSSLNWEWHISESAQAMSKLHGITVLVCDDDSRFLAQRCLALFKRLRSLKKAAVKYQHHNKEARGGTSCCCNCSRKPKRVPFRYQPSLSVLPPLPLCLGRNVWANSTPIAGIRQRPVGGGLGSINRGRSEDATVREGFEQISSSQGHVTHTVSLADALTSQSPPHSVLRGSPVRRRYSEGVEEQTDRNSAHHHFDPVTLESGTMWFQSENVEGSLYLPHRPVNSRPGTQTSEDTGSRSCGCCWLGRCFFPRMLHNFSSRHPSQNNSDRVLLFHGGMTSRSGSFDDDLANEPRPSQSLLANAFYSQLPAVTGRDLLRDYGPYPFTDSQLLEDRLQACPFASSVILGASDVMRTPQLLRADTDKEKHRFKIELGGDVTSTEEKSTIALVRIRASSASEPLYSVMGLDGIKFPYFSMEALKDSRGGVSKSPLASAKECAFCLGTFSDCDVCTEFPGCLHVFHHFCLVSWVDHRDKIACSQSGDGGTLVLRCPLCQQSFQEQS